jgi:uncharacterized coiled-coil protein SlyX
VTPSDLQKLRALAEAATQPSPWDVETLETDGRDVEYVVLDRDRMWVCQCGAAPADAEYIAAASPSVVLGLLDYIAGLESFRASDEDHINELDDQLAAAQAECERLRAENADARAMIEMAAESLVSARRACDAACDLASNHLDAAMEEPSRYTRSCADLKYAHIAQIREVARISSLRKAGGGR